MKSLLTHNWRAKLVSLLIAAVIWLVIKRNVEDGGRVISPAHSQMQRYSD